MIIRKRVSGLCSDVFFQNNCVKSYVGSCSSSSCTNVLELLFESLSHPCNTLYQEHSGKNTVEEDEYMKRATVLSTGR